MNNLSLKNERVKIIDHLMNYLIFRVIFLSCSKREFILTKVLELLSSCSRSRVEKIHIHLAEIDKH